MKGKGPMMIIAIGIGKKRKGKEMDDEREEMMEDEDVIKLSKKELLKLTALSDKVEEALGRLRACGISLKPN